MQETIYTLPSCPVVIALLTDLHGREYQKIIRSVEKQSVDLICIAGDFVYGSWPKDDRSPLTTQENVLPFLKGCAALAPTFVSLGNHEKWLDDTDLNTIRSTGVTLLDNSFTNITINGTNVALGGLTSATVLSYRRIRNAPDGPEAVLLRYPRKDSTRAETRLKSRSEKPETSWLRRFISTPGYHILLSHNPEYFDLLPPGIDLTLSGHAHGGQLRYWSPRSHKWEGLYAPSEGWFPKYTSGVFTSSNSHLVVSRGLSNTAAVPRLFNPPEIIYVKYP